jgi:type I restriction-modification system DNA methylase subunit
MEYKYFGKNNYGDFSSGKVIFQKSRNPNFPVRLAGELFSRCLERINKTKNICVYDPCCGAAYLATVLGFLFNEKIATIYGSDIAKESVAIARNNLSLLSSNGIEERRKDLTDLAQKYGRQSHIDALHSLDNMAKRIKHGIRTDAFLADILNRDSLKNKNFCADIVITDVPYGGLAAWTGEAGDQTTMLLDTLVPVINKDTIIAIVHSKNQKPDNRRYNRIKKLKAGHRIMEILKLN